MKIRLSIFFCCLLFLSFGQFQSSPSLGGKLGVFLQIGSHEQAIGLNINGFYSDYFYQWNVNQQVIFYRKGLANRQKFWESSSSVSLFLLGGRRTITSDFQIGRYQHQSEFERAIGYTYLWYYDQAKTSQRSGAWTYQEDYFSIHFENDIFGGQGKDRYRTGNLTVNYRYEQWKFQSQLILWTGQTSGSVWNRNAGLKMPNGYRDLSSLPYGKTSHGIVNLGVLYHSDFHFNQVSSVRIGLDSEQIRHFFQNRLMHDLIWLPKSYERTTPHYPRLNDDGLPVFSAKERKKDRFYWQIGNE